MTSATSPRGLEWFSRRELAKLPALLRVAPGDPAHQVTGKRILQGLLLLLLAGGAAGLLAFFRGHHVLGTTHEIPWGVLIAGYVFFVVSSTGLCLVSCLGHIFGIEILEPIAKRSVFLALVMMLSGFALIGLELERPLLLMWMAVASPNLSSPIWWMGMLYGVYLLALAGELYLLLARKEPWARRVCQLKSIVAVAANTNLGFVFGSLHGRPFWFGGATPVYFIATAFVSGTALMMLMVYLTDRFSGEGTVRPPNEVLLRFLGKLLGLFLGILLLFTVWRALAGLASGGEHLFQVVRSLLVGPLFVSFWLFEGLLVLGLPLVVVLSGWRTRTGALVFAAAVTTLGMFLVRYNFVYAGQMLSLRPLTGPMGEIFDYSPPFKGTVAGILPYTPSWVEIAIVLGAVSFTILAYVVGNKVLTLGEEAEG
ncbi:MAG: hypothetical protein FJ125_05375 [Deltaproteobacteria bacterium]|nr:hypothetical protein [Deltaproteobacteria bacterium]